MAELTLMATVQRQIRLLQQVCETLTTRALAGQRSDLESLFLAQGHLEHWLQYLSPLALEASLDHGDAPPPLAELRPAPPLPHEAEDFARAREALDTLAAQASQDGLDAQRPRVTFPPEPLWVEDLERVQEDHEADAEDRRR